MPSGLRLYQMLKKNIEPGDLIVWRDGGNIGIFVKKVELHAQRNIASRNFNPKWVWLIEFNDPGPWSYSEDWGAREDMLMSGTLGEIYHQKK